MRYFTSATTSLFVYLLLASTTARADITYSYGTVQLQPHPGRISGSFTASEAAIADGILTAGEL